MVVMTTSLDMIVYIHITMVTVAMTGQVFSDHVCFLTNRVIGLTLIKLLL